MTTTARAIVDEVLGRAMTREIWTGNYDKALSLSVQDFDLGAVLPAVFYMFRFGHRRGQGKFLETFGAGGTTAKEKKRLATIDRVAENLAQTNWFSGFDGPTERAILGDLLLCYCLENRNRALGRTEQIQRVAPAHYMASWIDLPESVAWMRFIPETIVALLADQSGSVVELTKEGERSWFAVGRGFEDNVLLKAFHQGVRRGEPLADLRGDRFEEEVEVGLDQLLMIRLAQSLGQAPDRLRGGGGERISNQRPIAAQPTRYFSEDIRHFVRAYSGVIPRHAFVELLESCMAVGLTTIVMSVIELLFDWADTGQVCEKCNQRPPQLFVDTSQGIDRNLRGLAEQSLTDFLRRVERFPVILMALRILDYEVRYDPQLKKVNLPTRPYATEWLGLLGEVLHARRGESKSIFDDLERKSSRLEEGLRNDFPEAAEILKDERHIQPNVVWRLAEAITLLQGRANTQQNLLKMIDSALFLDRPNGLAAKRRVNRQTGIGGNKKTSDLRRLVFTDSVLDYLVHVHVLHGNKSGYRARSFRRFLQILRERYGFCVDVAPMGMTISNELLEANRSILERRLRDLGLWVGVNDAEAMKRLQPRFGQTEYENDLD